MKIKALPEEVIEIINELEDVDCAQAYRALFAYIKDSSVPAPGSVSKAAMVAFRFARLILEKKTSRQRRNVDFPAGNVDLKIDEKNAHLGTLSEGRFENRPSQQPRNVDFQIDEKAVHLGTLPSEGRFPNRPSQQPRNVDFQIDEKSAHLGTPPSEGRFPNRPSQHPRNVDLKIDEKILTPNC